MGEDRTYAIVSGKGGTGKTTLAAIFALLAAEREAVVMADCDVEASNLPLALGAGPERVTPFEGGTVAAIEPRACMGCGSCAQVCRSGAIREPDLDAHDVPTLAYEVDPLLCEGCGACTLVGCPNAAISMESRRVGDVVLGHGPSGVVVSGRLEPGMDLSGRLVTEVREAAAREAGDGLLLVDGPPGVGCPFLSAIAGVSGLVAVTEPSVSGAHDLERLVVVARRFDVPVRVVLNKADLSTEGALLIESLCDSWSVESVGRVPFDEVLAVLPHRLAQAEGRVDVRSLMDGSRGVQGAVAVWERLTL